MSQALLGPGTHLSVDGSRVLYAPLAFMRVPGGDGDGRTGVGGVVQSSSKEAMSRGGGSSRKKKSPKIRYADEGDADSTALSILRSPGRATVSDPTTMQLLGSPSAGAGGSSGSPGSGSLDAVLGGSRPAIEVFTPQVAPMVTNLPLFTSSMRNWSEITDTYVVPTDLVADDFWARRDDHPTQPDSGGSRGGLGAAVAAPTGARKNRGKRWSEQQWSRALEFYYSSLVRWFRSGVDDSAGPVWKYSRLVEVKRLMTAVRYYGRRGKTLVPF